jgi:ADP-ribose pyrophosphatase
MKDEPDLHLRETTVSRTELLQGNFLHVVRDTVRLPSGAQATREFVLHPGAVMIVALLDDGRVVLERQFRHAMQAVMIEFPAGKVDPGEDRLVCAQRELLEETGYRASEWAFACRLAPTVAYSDEIIDIWFARGLTVGERALDEGEFLDVIAATPEELNSWCFSGKVIDCKTLIGSMWLQNVLRGEWTLSWQGAEPGPHAGESGA